MGPCLNGVFIIILCDRGRTLSDFHVASKPYFFYMLISWLIRQIPLGDNCLSVRVWMGAIVTGRAPDDELLPDTCIPKLWPTWFPVHNLLAQAGWNFLSYCS